MASMVPAIVAAPALAGGSVVVAPVAAAVAFVIAAAMSAVAATAGVVSSATGAAAAVDVGNDGESRSGRFAARPAGCGGDRPLRVRRAVPATVMVDRHARPDRARDGDRRQAEVHQRRARPDATADRRRAGGSDDGRAADRRAAARSNTSSAEHTSISVMTSGIGSKNTPRQPPTRRTLILCSHCEHISQAQ